MNAGGNIGKELVRELTGKTADFVAGYRSQKHVDTAEQEGLKAVIADYSRPETLRSAMEGVESIFIVTPPAPNLEELEGNAVDAAQAVGVKHIVKLSVWCAEQGEFLFAEPHGAIEKQIKASGIPFTFLRPTGFMQNMLANAPTIEAQGAFYAPAGPARVAEIDFRDVARVAVVTLLENGHAGKAYELSGPEAMSHSERAEVLSKVLGKKIEYVSPTDAEWKAMVLGFGVPEWQADGVIDLLHYYKAGKSQRVSPSVEDVTGAKPIDYRQFVQDYADAFR